jgi:hypothetical protein
MVLLILAGSVQGSVVDEEVAAVISSINGKSAMIS